MKMIKQILSKIREGIIIGIGLGILIFLFGSVFGFQSEKYEITESEVKIMIQEALFDFHRENNFVTRDEIINTVMDLYHNVDTGDSIKTLIMEIGERGPKGEKGDDCEINEQNISEIKEMLEALDL